MRGLDLHTVCEEAGCPNIYECWGSGTATLMILGDRCTRAADSAMSRPASPPSSTSSSRSEPRRRSARWAGHAVVTSVNRDDLDDGGSAIFASTIREIRRRSPDCDIEVLIPDFKGDQDALETVMAEHPEVLNHNTETVLRLQRDVRTSASYGRSLALLARAGWIEPSARVKSGLIVGMGETATRCWRLWPTCGRSISTSSPSASTSDPRLAIGRSTATSIPMSSPCTGNLAKASGSRMSSRDRWCAPPTTPRTHCRAPHHRRFRWRSDPRR